MILAATAAPVTIDPALLAIIPIVTALLTIVAGLVGAWIQARREHNKWLRETRFRAFTESIAAIDAFSHHVRGMTEKPKVKGEQTLLQMRLSVLGDAASQKRYLLEESDRRMDRIDEAFAPLQVLGPDAIREALVEYSRASRLGDDPDVASAAGKHAIALMRRALKVVK